VFGVVDDWGRLGCALRCEKDLCMCPAVYFRLLWWGRGLCVGGV